MLIGDTFANELFILKLALSLSDIVFFTLKNVKMPANVGILSFMSKLNFRFSSIDIIKMYDLEARK